MAGNGTWFIADSYAKHVPQVSGTGTGLQEDRVETSTGQSCRPWHTLTQTKRLWLRGDEPIGRTDALACASEPDPRTKGLRTEQAAE